MQFFTNSKIPSHEVRTESSQNPSRTAGSDAVKDSPNKGKYSGGTPFFMWRKPIA